MNYKTTLMKITAILRKWNPVSLLVLFSFLLLGTNNTYAQTLITDSSVPVLDVCSDYKQFTVKITKDNNACNNATLAITIPKGFELESGSVAIDGVQATYTPTISEGVTNVILSGLDVGNGTGELTITYNVKALCDIISTPGDSTVGYELTDCSPNPKPGTSEAINIRYAVLRINVNPDPIMGNIGQVIERTITVKNQGNGEIPSFTVDRNLGSGLLHDSYDFSALIAAGWSIDFSNPDKIIFSGSSLKTGETITFKEKVKIDTCELTPTNYEVYYGCSDKCTTSGVNHTATHVIALDVPNVPKLEVIQTQGASITCFDNSGTNKIIWTIKNTGSVPTKEITFEISTSDIGGSIDPTNIIVDGVPAIVVGTPGANPTSVTIKIPALAAGATTTLEFDQKYDGLNPVQTGGCESGKTMFSYVKGVNSYKASYDYDNSCAPINIAGSMNGTSHVSNFNGDNLGELDIYKNSNTTSNIEYLFTAFNISHAGLNQGDQFVVTIDLTGCFEIIDLPPNFEGNQIVKVNKTKATITFTYGTAPWATGTNLNFTNKVLNLPIKLVCGTGTCEGSYIIGGKLNKKNTDGTDCPTPVMFKCNETELNGYCDPGNCPDGLLITSSHLERVSLGIATDTNGKPIVPFAPTTNANTRLFLEGDLLEISQTSDVRLTSGTSFSKVRLEVNKSDEISANIVANSGKILLTRGATDYPFTNLLVSQTSTKYILEFDLATQTPNALQDGDVVKLSLQVKAGNGGNSLTHPLLKKFKVNSFLIDTQNNPEVAISCDIARTVTGLYVSRKDDVRGNKVDFVDCTNETNSAVFETELSVIDGYKFEKEYRKLFKPETAEIIVPDYLELTAVKLVVNNQPWLTTNEVIIPSTSLTVISNGYVADLKAALKEMTKNTLGAGNDIDYLNEAFQLAITPVVTLKGCEPTNVTKEQIVGITLKGKILDGEGVESNYIQQKASNVVYNTGIGTLTLETANNIFNGKLSPDGTEVSWIVKVESEGARNFNSVWFSKTVGLLNIKSVQQVTSYGNQTTIGAEITPENELYKLGDFTSNSPKYYIIKADVIDCEKHDLTLRIGYSCDSNDYPVSKDEGCRFESLTLTHKTIVNLIQTEIVEQFNGNPNAKPDICDGIWYTVQLHNGGDSKLDNLEVTIPSNHLKGLTLEKFEYSNVFAGNSTPTFTLGNQANVNTTNGLKIALQGVALNTLERIQIKLYFTPDCDFISGTKHTITPSAKNTCSTNLNGSEVNSATTRRMLILGGANAFPELAEIKNEVDLDPVLTVGANLRALYNFELLNTGIGSTDAITTDYKVDFKLPKGWTIVGNPNDYLLPQGTAAYQNMSTDITTGITTYVYNIIQDVPVNGKLTLKNVSLKYTPTDAIDFTCEAGTIDLGDIVVKVYQNIPNISCAGLTCPNGIDQILLEARKPILLPLKGDLEVVPRIGDYFICNPSVNGGAPTLADIILEAPTQTYHLDWYENYQDAENDVARLPITTPLTDGMSYYVINRFIADGDCKSEIGMRRVFFKDNNLSGTTTTLCSVDNQTYRVRVTLTGKAPFNVTGTGAPGTFASNVWTSDPIPASTPYGAGTPYEITFTDANECTPLIITGDAPMCCELEITCPQAVTIACGTSIDPSVTGIPTVLKSCGNTSYDYKDGVISACTNGVKTFTRTFTVTDAQGNKKTCTQQISIKDDKKPIFNEALPANVITVSCASEVPAAVSLTATDNCGNAKVTFNQTKVDGSCVNNFTLTRVWTATDDCGNITTHTQVITVKDDIKPTFIGALPAASVTVSCASEVPAAATLTANDNCGTATVVMVEEITNKTCDNKYTLTRVWTATDVCGNATTYTQTITVDDKTAPSISTNAQNKTVQCSSTGYQTELDAWLANNGGAIATDNCGAVNWSNDSATAKFVSTCGSAGSITVTFTATDACGNESTTTAIFTVEDTTKPIFTSDLPTDVTVSCAGDIPATEEATLTATDNCTDDADIEITVKDVKSNVSPICANNYTITRTYTAKDACGNTTTHTQIIKVEDKTKPTFVEALPQNITYECSSKVPTAPTLTADDNCGIATVTFKETKTAGSCESSFVLTRVWTATDECGNSISHRQIITVEDKVKPTFTVEPQNKVVECDGLGNLDGPDGFHAWLASNAGAEATDNCGSVTITHLIEDTNTICGGSGTIIVDFIAKDECGNITIKQATYAIFDRTPPTIADEDQPKDLEIECGKNIEDELNAWLSNNGGATATDSCGLITWKHNYAGKLSVCGAPIKVIFTATDSCGNFTRSNEVEVRLVDNIAPILTKEAQSVTVQCGANTKQALDSWLANHAGAEATDSCGIVTWSHDYDASKLPIACSANDTVTVIFTASDSCGNEVTTTATFKIEDTTAPTLVKAAQNKTVECDGNGNKAELDAWLAIHGGATATDTCDANLTWSNDYNNGANFASSCGSTGNVVVTFTATDACGNEVKTIATFTIVDTTKPIFTTKPQNEVVECDGSGNTSAYNTWLASFGNSVAEDICGTVTYSYAVVDTVVGCGKTSKTTVKFTATDACGNKVSEQATFEIVDTTKPVITTEAQNLTLECGNTVDAQITTWLNNHGGAVSTDSCGNITWSHNYKGLEKACGNTGEATVIFTATDSCGNTSTTSAIVKVEDTKAPVLTKEAQSVTVQCGANTKQALESWLANHAGAEATDSCGIVTWSHDYDASKLPVACSANDTVTVIFTASDSCGNEVTTTATFKIEDTTSPTLVRAAQNKTVECDGNGNKAELDAWLAIQGGATATDTCDANLTWSNDYNNGANFASSCGSAGNVVVTFTATDACGNEVKTIATFTIVDTTKPIFTTKPQNEVVECDGSGNTSAYNTWLASFGNSVAEDICGTVTYSYAVVDTVVGCGKTSKTTVKFTATDACGNRVSEQATFEIVDTKGPEFITEAEDLVVECDGTGNNSDLTAWLNNRAGATAKDDCSTGLTWSHNFKGLTKACGNTGATEVTFTVTDACGNTNETKASFTIVDTTAPVFNVNLPQDRTIECSDSIPEVAFVTAEDLCSKATVSFKEERVDGNCVNNYKLVRTWIAADACGNTTQHEQIITVQDTTAPEFVGELPKAEIFIRCEDLKDAEVLKAVDNCGPAVVTTSDEVVPGECDTKYSILRTWVATDLCGNKTTFAQTINLSCQIEVFNAVTPNGDGMNDELVLNGIECYPGNTVEIFNRWGVLVYETKNYNSNNNTFKGFSEGRVTVNKDPKLPTGTYYYVIKYDYDLGNGQVYPIQQAGYLHLENSK